jgi:hypothetical protein
MDPSAEITQELAEIGIYEQNQRDALIGSNHGWSVSFGFRSGGCRDVRADIDPAVFSGLLRGTVADVPQL